MNPYESYVAELGFSPGSAVRHVIFSLFFFFFLILLLFLSVFEKFIDLEKGV